MTVELVIAPAPRDLGDGFTVRRALPSAQRRAVGPFVFFDQMGPTVLAAGRGLDVRPHPHIGLATVTYVFAGAIQHRDSLGTVQRIEPGAVNWMTAGSGIVHSERSPADARARGGQLFGIQTWVALPRRAEETAPAFVHVPAEGVPLLQDGGVAVRLVAGSLAGVTAPVPTLSAMLYADVTLAPGARFEVPGEIAERAVYVTEGSVAVGESSFAGGGLVVLRAGAPAVLAAESRARVLVIGGEPLDGPRHVWWNFVSSSRERIEQAKADWQAGRFPAVPGETEFIPLPERKPQERVDYP